MHVPRSMVALPREENVAAAEDFRHGTSVTLYDSICQVVELWNGGERGGGDAGRSLNSVWRGARAEG